MEEDWRQDRDQECDDDGGPCRTETPCEPCFSGGAVHCRVEKNLVLPKDAALNLAIMSYRITLCVLEKPPTCLKSARREICAPLARRLRGYTLLIVTFTMITILSGKALLVQHNYVDIVKKTSWS